MEVPDVPDDTTSPTGVATTLYRLFDESDVLLYVGIAVDPGRRFVRHREDKAWWGEVANIALAVYPSRSEALAAEREAIKTEKPRHNVRHNGVPPHLAATAPTYTCATCDGRITDEEGGYLQVDRRAADRHAAAPSPTYTIGDFEFLDLNALRHPDRPRRAQWHAVHTDCDTIGDHAYWHDLERVRTWPTLLGFVAHVIEKPWVNEGTNLSGFLYDLTSGPAGPARRALTRRDGR